MIEIDYFRVPDLIASEEFRSRIIEAMKKSAVKHGQEIETMRNQGHEIERGDFEVRADLMIMRCEYLIAREVGVDFKAAEDGDQMTFVYDHRDYLFTLLQRIVTVEAFTHALNELRAKK